MACAVALGVLRDPGLAQDAAQDAYLRAFRRLGDLEDPAGFVVWFRRVVITVALNLRRSRRTTLLRVDEMPDVPVLDEAESRWTDAQRQRLSAALLTLTPADRRLCDRRYHGGWTMGRLAQDAGVPEPVMRKRLQRVRDKLRKEIDVSEQRGLTPDAMHPDLPAAVVELLSRPQLTDLPEHPVGDVLARLRGVFAGHASTELPEIVDLSHARAGIASDAIYVEASELHRLDDRRILRYDLTLPLLLDVRYTGTPLRLFAAGKAYRRGRIDATHLEAFHQAEVLSLDERAPTSIRGGPPGRCCSRSKRCCPAAASASRRTATRCAARPGSSTSTATASGSRCWRGACSPTASSSTSAGIRPCTPPSASATGSNGWQCCATASTTSARSKRRASPDGAAAAQPCSPLITRR